MKIEINDGETTDDQRQNTPETEGTIDKMQPKESLGDEPICEHVEPGDGAVEPVELPKLKRDEIILLEEQVENLTNELEMREAELVEIRDNAMRSVAEAENFKKRVAREGEEREKYAAQSIVEQLLPALDNLSKAMDAAGLEGAEQSHLLEGVSLTYGQIMDILGKKGLEKIEVLGKPFDPMISEALQMMETDEFEDGHVAAEYLPGYKFNDRVIRPAKVVVAKTPEND